jgi:hypothetical protein
VDLAQIFVLEKTLRRKEETISHLDIGHTFTLFFISVFESAQLKGGIGQRMIRR